MISGISSNGSGGLGGNLFQSLTQADAAEGTRPQAQADVGPVVDVSPTQPDESPADIERIASVVANSLANRIYDASGISHSLTEEQNIQAGGIDTRR